MYSTCTVRGTGNTLLGVFSTTLKSSTQHCYICLLNDFCPNFIGEINYVKLGTITKMSQKSLNVLIVTFISVGNLFFT